jgi:flagellar basal-body rod protein FlgB
MIKNYILKHTVIPRLSKGLDVYSLRQKTTADNIANVQTEGYRRKEVKFEERLQSAMSSHLQGNTTNPNHIKLGGGSVQQVDPQVVEDTSADLESGVNNVNIETEMVDQVKNEIRFLFGSRLINRNFAFLRASIKGRFDQ